ncbi:amino acid adenylation domain-containing protein, partial [Pyxidicoccus sp. 3LG]
AQLGWWRQHLLGAPPVLEVPTDRPRPAVQSYRGAAHPVHLPRELSAALEALSQREGVTPFMALLAVWQLLLSRYSGQDDIVVGSPIAGRRHSEVEGLIGFFVNTLVLRSRIDSRASFRELLAQVRTSTLAAYEHQDVPFEKLIEELQPQRSLSHSPLFQAMLALQNTPNQGLDSGAADSGALKLRAVDTELQTTKFDLDLLLTPSPDGFVGALAYRTDLFDSGTVQRMVRHLQTLLEHAVSSPDTAVHQLQLMAPDERRQLLVEWNDTRRELPWSGCFHERFEDQAARTPRALAALDGSSQLTFDQLNRRANQLAHALRQRGVGPEVPVALCMERSVEQLVALLGVLKAGGAYVPVDPSYPSQRLAFMLQDCKASIVLTQRHLAPRLEGASEQALCLDDPRLQEALARESEANPPRLSEPRHLAYVIYTSGSTGRPKGVMVQHASVMNLHAALAATALSGVRGPLRVSVNAPLAFDASVKQLIQLCDGHALCVVPQEVRQDIARLSAWVEEHSIDVLDCSPSHLRLLLDESLGATQRPLRVLVGGEAVDEALWTRLATHPFIEAYNVYGPTECTVDSTAHAMRGAARPTLGGPLTNVQLYVLDEHLQPVPAGIPGELFIGGAGLARGYLGRPELTAERFVPDPFGTTPGARLYRTGDKVRWLAGGVLDYLGRVDFQVKLRGFRMELGEIESSLEQLPGVRRAVVLVREDVPGDQRLAAYVVPAEGEASLTASALRTALKERLPEYMVPSAFLFMEALPLTAHGKVDRKALPALDSAASTSEYVAPRTPTEQRLASLWSEVLAVPRVGASDDFFALGGHSLLATQLVSRVRSAFDVELPLRALFEDSTLEAFALRLEAALRSSSSHRAPPVVPVPRTGALPLSFAQQRLWFLDQLEPGSTSYNLPMPLHVSGPLDLAALRRAFDALVQRHEVLRTHFRSEAGQPVQVIAAPGPLPIEVVDLSTLPAEDRRSEALRLVQLDTQRPFDLASGPLLRVTVLTLSPEEHVLAINMHHVVSDGWSQGVLIREMGAFYEGFRQGRPVQLPELPVQYADYAAWQRGWLQGEVLEAQLSWWREQLEGAPAALELPTDRPRPAKQSFRGAQLPVQLPAALSAQLPAFCQREGVTPFMVLLATWQLLLSRYSGQDDVVVGSPIAGRRHSELEGLIGFFINTLVLRSRLDSRASFRQLLAQVRTTSLGAFEHQDVPFENSSRSCSLSAT